MFRKTSPFQRGGVIRQNSEAKRAWGAREIQEFTTDREEGQWWENWK